MDVADLSFRVDSSGLDSANRKLDDITRTSKRTQTATDKLDQRFAGMIKTVRNLVGAYASLQGVRALVNLADQYKNINARLQIVSKSQAEFARAQQLTFEVAQRTSTGLEVTARLYGRIHQALKDMGGTQQLSIRLTETINKAFVVSGTNAAEAAGAITQLLQGFSAGALRGEEFNSVMEQAPRIADALSKSLGVTRGELRSMAEQGLLTTQVVVKALKEAGAEIDAEFSKIPITVERALTQLANAFTKAVGEIDNGLGATGALAQGIQVIAQNLAGLMRTAIALGGVIATIYAGKALSSITEYLRMKVLVAAQTKATVAAMRAEEIATAQLTLSKTRQAQAIAVSSQIAAKAELEKARATIAGTQATYASMLASSSRAKTEIEMARIGIAMTQNDIAAARAAVALGTARSGLVRANAALMQANLGLAASQKALDAAMTVSTAKIFTWGNALNVVLAGVIGWQIGDWARNEFRAVAVFGDNLVYAFAQSMAYLRDSAERAFAYFKAAAMLAIDAVRDRLAGLVEGMVSLSKVALPWYLKSTITDTAAKKLEAIAKAIRGEQEGTEGLADELKRLNDVRGEATAANEKMLVSLRDATDQKFFGAKASGELADAEGDLAVAVDETGESVKGALAEWKKLDAIYMRNLMANEDATIKQAAYNAELAKGTQALRDELIQRQLQAQSAGLSAEAIARLSAIQQINNRFTAEGTDLTKDQIVEMRNQALAAYDLEVANRELGEEARRSAEISANAWEDFTGQLVDAFEDGTEGVKDLFKRMIADLLKQIIQSGLLQAVSSIFGGGVTGGATGGTSLLGSLFSSFAGGGSSAGGGGIASLFGGGGSSSGGLFAGLFGGAAAGGTSLAGGTAALGGANAAAAGFQASGATAGASGGATAGIGAAGVAAIIAVAMLVNDGLYGRGWRANASSTTLPNGASVSGGGSTIAREVQRSFDPLGILPDRWGSILSGSATVARLFGRSAPRLTDGSTAYNFGPGGVTGSETYETIEKGGFFRSDKRRTHQFGLSEDAQSYGEGIFSGLNQTIADSLTMLGSDAEVNFNAAMRVVQKFNKKGEVESTQLFVDVLGRSFAAATEEEALTRLAAEATIAAIDASMGGVDAAMGAAIASADQFVQGTGGAAGDRIGRDLAHKILEGVEAGAPERVGEEFTRAQGQASAIAERWRGDAEKLMEGAQFLLSAASDINAGFALLGDGSTLLEITELTEDLAIEGETLLQTYQRMVLATKLLDDALELSGISINKTREEIVTLATDIAIAAGGLERASSLWNTYFNEFFSDQELAQQRLDRANASRASALESIGLDGGISNEAFRAAFEAALPDLTAEQIYQWLLASEAIAAANASQTAYNGTLEEAAVITSAALDAVRDHMAALREARDEYSSFAATLRRELATFSMTELQQEMRDIDEWAKDATNELNSLARAAGMAGAAEADLAVIHEIAAARAAEAIARLRNSARSLVEQLYGGGGDDEFGLIEAGNNYVDNTLNGIGAIGAATNDLYASQLAGIQSIQAYLDAQLLGDTSSLTPAEQLDEALRQFMATFDLAMGGDTDALNDIVRLANIVLTQGRAFDPSDYPELEALIRGMLGQLVGILPEDPTGIGTDPLVGGGYGPGGQIGPVVGAINDGTQTISEERAALVAELFDMVRELMSVTGQSLTEVAESIGLNVQDFIRDLGINLDALTVETTLQLAHVAGQLGISLTDLAQQVGVDLGELADQQSLLNQALGATIESLPDEDRRALQPLFDNIANATTATDARAAIAVLTDATNTIGGATAAALQPFLEGVVITTELGEANAYLSELTVQGSNQLLELQNIVNELRGTGQGPGLPGSGGGTGLPGGGLPGPTAQGSMQIAALERIEARLVSLEATTANAGSNTVTAIGGEQAKRTRTAERKADMLQATYRS